MMKIKNAALASKMRSWKWSVVCELNCRRGEKRRRLRTAAWPLYLTGMKLRQLAGVLTRKARTRWLPSEELSVAELAGLDPTEF